jgi:hypothetical protein
MNIKPLLPTVGITPCRSLGVTKGNMPDADAMSSQGFSGQARHAG